MNQGTTLGLILQFLPAAARRQLGRPTRPAASRALIIWVYGVGHRRLNTPPSQDSTDDSYICDTDIRSSLAAIDTFPKTRSIYPRRLRSTLSSSMLKSKLTPLKNN